MNFFQPQSKNQAKSLGSRQCLDHQITRLAPDSLGLWCFYQETVGFPSIGKTQGFLVAIAIITRLPGIALVSPEDL